MGWLAITSWRCVRRVLGCKDKLAAIGFDALRIFVGVQAIHLPPSAEKNSAYASEDRDGYDGAWLNGQMPRIERLCR
jgi:hypothetical protein